MKKLPDNEFVYPKESTLGDAHISSHNQFEIDVYRLNYLTKEVPQITVPTETFMNDLKERSWTDDNGKSVSPQEVIDTCRSAGGAKEAIAAHPEFSTHIKRLENVGSRPIIVFESKIIDGMHRFAEVASEGKTSIRAKVLSEIPKGAIIKINEAEASGE